MPETKTRLARLRELLRPGPRGRLPLRTRLTLWYLLTLTAILALFLSFLYWQVQRRLLTQMDASLRLAATQAQASVTAEADRLALPDLDELPAEEAETLQRLLGEDFIIFLLSPEGALWDRVGEEDEFPPQPPQLDLNTIRYDDDDWRVYSQQIRLAGGAEGWLQVAQEMESVSDTLAGLRAQMWLGLPLALLLAGIGGFFLASRALHPIERITQTAEAINGGDLSRRIDYEGPADEVGRLAATFDSMLDRLQAAFERERRFTGDAAHELRTPLTAMKGRIEVTLSRPRTADAYEETLQEMSRQVDRLIRLSNDLLFMARLDQVDKRTPHSNVALAELLPLVIDQVKPLAARKSITLSQGIPPHLAVPGDLDLLIRLFLNLLHNAIKYTPPEGRVTVEGKQTAALAAITITDTGPGIPAEHLPHLFDRFYRVEEHRGRLAEEQAHGGAGLGLAIAAEIARIHGGTIDVESLAGEGTTFTVHLPLA